MIMRRPGISRYPDKPFGEHSKSLLTPCILMYLFIGYYKRFFVEEMKLGSGGYGGVWLCRHVLQGFDLGRYAVKKVYICPFSSLILHLLSVC